MPQGVNIPKQGGNMPGMPQGMQQGQGMPAQVVGMPPSQQGGGGDMRPGSTDLNTLLSQAVQDPALDQLCPGKTRKSTDIGIECWNKIWQVVGCKAENLPQYIEWHKV